MIVARMGEAKHHYGTSTISDRGPKQRRMV
jgi:hypothetical protein